MTDDDAHDWDATQPAWLGELLVCPGCDAGLDRDDERLDCTGCGGRYPVVEGIPVFTEAANPDGTAPDGSMAEPPRIPAVERVVETHGGARNVDVGCGTGRNLGQFDGRVAACDLDLPSLLAARDRAASVDADVALVCCDATSLPLPDEWAGFTLSSEVFEHVPPSERGSYVSELERVTASEGAIAVSAPIETRGGAAVAWGARRLGLLDATDDGGEHDHPALTIEILREHGFAVRGCLDAPAADSLRRRGLGVVAALYDAVAARVPGASTHAVGVKRPGSE